MFRRISRLSFSIQTASRFSLNWFLAEHANRLLLICPRGPEQWTRCRIRVYEMVLYAFGVRLGFSVYGSINEIPISDKDPPDAPPAALQHTYLYIYKQRVLGVVKIYIYRHAGACESISRGTRSVCGWFLINIHGGRGESICIRIYMIKTSPFYL